MTYPFLVGFVLFCFLYMPTCGEDLLLSPPLGKLSQNLGASLKTTMVLELPGRGLFMLGINLTLE